MSTPSRTTRRAAPSSGRTASSREALARALRDVSYEILPFKGTEESVLRHVPREVPLTVTVTAGKGLEPTLVLAERLAGHGYDVAPHLAARLVRDDAHVEEIAGRLADGGVRRLFVIGGDAPEPAGQFSDALGLLTSIRASGRSFEGVGIGGYPEGHGSIPDEAIRTALEAKAPMATHIITQLCFRAATTIEWAREVREHGVRLPVRVGLPGAVSRQRLIRISAGLGLGQSARFLLKQQSMVRRFFLPGGYRPDRLVNGLLPALGGADTGIQGFHLFTFNEVENTERWRQNLLTRLTG
jgi:methylenetetrahydrofolate reductase (NADPH)